ncbi:MAG: hypothetical protein HY709_10220 [Candidatus Latescibacteria bacterium]|nr:hypothetical protein [Candidatus Latescibacterota bacterium]
MSPEKVFRSGSCFASVFANEIVKDSTVRQIRTVAFAKRSLDKDGNWQSTTSLSVNDLPKAVLVLQKAFEYLTSISPTTFEEEEPSATL